MAVRLDLFIDKLTMMLAEVEDQRLQEICAEHPELLDQRKNVVVWKQEAPGNPMELRYLVTLNNEELAKFSVCTEFSGTHFTVVASDIEYCSNK